MKCRLLLLAFLLPVCMFAQHREFANLPGNAHFDDLKKFRSYGKVSEIFLDQKLFNMIDYESTDEGEELKKLLKPIKLIVLYTVDDIRKSYADSVRQEFSEIDSGLISRDWNKLMSFDEGNEMANIYLKYTGKNTVAGLAITFLGGSGKKYKANIINIIGEIDMNSIGKIGQKFRLPALGAVEGKEE
ncbi:MAG: DUF4252 domain-containing protein [Bacteroidota bacterium]